MVQTACTWESVVRQIKRDYPDVSTFSHKYKYLTVSLAEKYGLEGNQSLHLANFLGIKLFKKPLGIPDTWKVKLCKSFLSQKYVNPSDQMEYTVVVPPDKCGHLPYVIHRSGDGWADNRWFCEVLPELNKIIYDPQAVFPFSKGFNEAINAKKLTVGQVRTLNLFLVKLVPGIEGICSTCYEVMLPRSGAGERWLHQRKDGYKYEVRLSAAKSNGYPGQQTEYVSQTIYDENDKAIYAMWNREQCKIEYTDNMRQLHTHIPWDLYDFNKFNIGMPICQCKYQNK